MSVDKDKNNPKQVMFGKEVANAVDNFNQRIDVLKEKYSDFFKENEIDFDSNFIFQFSPHHASYNITSEKVKNKMGNEIENAYQDAFSELLK